MSTVTDFWGDVVEVELRTPLSIMREQASLLGTKTQNLVEASVETNVYGKDFAHTFQLVVPSLDFYTYDLFTVRHGADLYPVLVGDKAYKIEEEFTAWLKSKLSDPKTTHLVAKLLAQARS